MMAFGKTAAVSVFVVAMAASWTGGGWQAPQVMDWGSKNQNQQWQAMPMKDMHTMYMMKHDDKPMPAWSQSEQPKAWEGQNDWQMNQPPAHMASPAPVQQAVTASASSVAVASASNGTATASAVATAAVVQSDQSQGDDWKSSNDQDNWNKDDNGWSKSDDDSDCDHSGNKSDDWSNADEEDHSGWKHSDGKDWGQKHKDRDNDSDCDHQYQKEEDCQHSYSS